MTVEPIFATGDKVKIVRDDGLEMPFKSEVARIGHKWIYVTFGNPDILRRFLLSGRGAYDSKARNHIAMNWRLKHDL